VAAQAPHLELVVPAAADELRGLREATRDFAARHGVAQPERAALAVSEACTNAVLQSGNGTPGGHVRLVCDCFDDRVVFVVEGDARGFAARPDGGEMVVPMMAGLTDRVRFADGDGGLRTELTFAVA
jgi:anti-sigma regulatory factor (Ser/Thr protein kinase)